MAYALPIPTTRPALRIWPWVGALSSGLLLASPFLREAAWPLAWVALVPLLLAIRGQGAGRAFGLGWAAGAVFFGAALFWLNTFGIPAWGLASAFLGVYAGAFGAGLSLLRRGIPEEWGLAAAPVLWVALEVARSWGMLAFPWALLGASQIPNAPILQLASLAGPYGISFLVVLVNAASAAVVADPRRAWPRLLLVGAVLAAAIGFGWSVQRPTPAGTLHIAAVQPNVPLEQKASPQAAGEILGRLGVLIDAAAGTRPDLLILPESALPGDLFGDAGLRAWMRERARASRAIIVTGTHTAEGTNSATAMTPAGGLLGRYDKVRLVAFGERGTRPGRAFRPLRTPAGSLGVLICFESAFPGAARALVRGGAGLLVVITNDGWFGRTAAPFQHAALARLRAVESRRFVATSANTGVSNIIDPYGRVLAATGIFQGGVLFGDAAPRSDLTVFARYGTALEWLILVAGIVLFVPPGVAFVRKERDGPVFRDVVTAASPIVVWAALQPLAGASAAMTTYGVPAVLAAATWWAASRVPRVPTGLGPRGLGRAAGVAGVSVTVLAWLMTTAYARQGVPLPIGAMREIAGSAALLLPQAAVEDVWVRGLVYGAVARWRGWRAALLVSAVLSALLHAGGGPEALALGVVSGVVFGLIRAWSGNVLGIIPWHAGWEGFLQSVGLFYL